MRSDFLFAQPAIIFGVARLLDLFGQFDQYNKSRTEQEADAQGLYSDWRTTGWDVFVSIPEKEEDIHSMDQNNQIPLPLFPNP